MERTLNNKQPQTGPYIRPIILGGTSKATQEEAIVALGGIAGSQIGAANGIAPLDYTPLIPVTYFPTVVADPKPALDGPMVTYTGLPNNFYTITNYNSNTDYIIAANKGSVTRTNDVIKFTPDPSGGIHVITVNGKAFPIDVQLSYVDTPIILVPASGTTVHVNPFSVGFTRPNTYGYPFDPSHSYEIEIAEDENFTVNVFRTGQFFDDSLNVVKTINGVGSQIVHYIRVRMNNGIDWSNWSPVVSFLLKSNNYGSNLVQQIFETDPNFNEVNFGCSIALSKDGTILVISDPHAIKVNGSIATGAVYIYKLNGTGTFDYVRTLSPEFLTAGAVFGKQVFISSDMQSIFVSANYTTSGPLRGTFYIFTTTTADDYNTLAVATNYIDEYVPEQYTNQILSYTCNGDLNVIIASRDDGRIKVFNIDGTSIITTAIPIKFNVSIYIDINISISDAGHLFIVNHTSNWTDQVNDSIYVYIFDGVDWVIQSIIGAKDIDGDLSPLFTQLSKVSLNGDLIVVSALGQDGNNGFLVYEYFQGNWLRRQVTLPSPWNNTLYGGRARSIAISSDNKVILLGDPYSSMPGPLFDTGTPLVLSGNALIYTKQNDTWVMGYDFFTPDDLTPQRFGMSVAMTNNADTLAIAACKDYEPNVPTTGSVYIYK